MHCWPGQVHPLSLGVEGSQRKQRFKVADKAMHPGRPQGMAAVSRAGGSAQLTTPRGD